MRRGAFFFVLVCSASCPSPECPGRRGWASIPAAAPHPVGGPPRGRAGPRQHGDRRVNCVEGGGRGRRGGPRRSVAGRPRPPLASPVSPAAVAASASSAAEAATALLFMQVTPTSNPGVLSKRRAVARSRHRVSNASYSSPALDRGERLRRRPGRGCTWGGPPLPWPALPMVLKMSVCWTCNCTLLERLADVPA